MLGVSVTKVDKKIALFGLALAAVYYYLGSEWWVDVLSSFAVHFALLFLAGAVVALFHLRLLIAALNLTFAVLALSPLLLQQAPTTVRSADVQFALQNVHSQNIDHAPVLKALKESKADVFGLLEVNEAWLKDIKQHFPKYKVIARPRDDNFGLALVTRIPVKSHRFIESTQGVPSLEVLLMTERGPLLLELLHAPPPLGKKAWQRRNLLIRTALKRARGSRHPALLLGDFNLTPTSPQWKALFESSDFKRAGLPFGTWPALGGNFGICIDHLLISKRIEVSSASTLPRTSSDHRAQLIGIRLTR